jgi:hypothetical protein
MFSAQKSLWAALAMGAFTRYNHIIAQLAQVRQAQEFLKKGDGHRPTN